MGNSPALLRVSVSNGSYLVEWFRVRVGTVTQPLPRTLPHENQDHCNWAGCTTKIRTFNITTLDAIKYLTSDCILTRSVCRLCSSSRSFRSRFQIYDLTNTHSVAIENPQISHKIGRNLTATHRISVGL
jgi:alpha-N-acetylglucosamine transferase